jgi:hypothetical protein
MTIHSEDYSYCPKCSAEYIDKCDCVEKELEAKLEITIKALEIFTDDDCGQCGSGDVSREALKKIKPLGI